MAPKMDASLIVSRIPAHRISGQVKRRWNSRSIDEIAAGKDRDAEKEVRGPVAPVFLEAHIGGDVWGEIR
jgi:hypothetical protein